MFSIFLFLFSEIVILYLFNNSCNQDFDWIQIKFIFTYQLIHMFGFLLICLCHLVLHKEAKLSV